MTRHVNVPIFIPHLGCPNQCVFCNQKTISGVKEFAREDVKSVIEASLSTISDSDEVEIAFFGGSFTGIDEQLMISLLDTAYAYVSSGRVKSLRCSTRPDYIDVHVLKILKKYGVKTVELGLQSASDSVLKLSKRGHNREDEARACKMIVDSGFELVGQMMIGLPGSTLGDELETAEFIISSKASAVRIYPTVVFCDTELCDMARRGVYIPLTLEGAVERSAAVLEKFVDADVKAIRIGLCASDNLVSDETYFAGPNHPALGELVESRLYYKKIKRAILDTKLSENERICVSVPRGATSKAIGQKRCNKIRLEEEFSTKIRFIERKENSEYEVSADIDNGENKCT